MLVRSIIPQHYKAAYMTAYGSKLVHMYNKPMKFKDNTVLTKLITVALILH